ncbi:MAG: hypothetical protein QHH27_01650 [Clostridia bacterium]|nr:hypothetical protein [Clostridia bacterium]MDH7572241.1 hypothetical protein [Clostridia bacterium]
MGTANPQEFEELIRQKLPELLRRRPEFRHEIMGIMAETLATKDELAAILKRLEAHEEASRRRFEAMERRFEAIERRFEAVDRRFEAVERRFEAVDRRFEALERRLEGVITDLRDLRLEVSALSGRLGRGLEDIVRQTVERFSGQKFREAKRLVLQDEAGELYGVPAEVEFDLYLADDLSWVVEVKSHVKTGDVLNFYRKKLFAEAQLGRPLKGLLISASIDRQAKKRCRELGLEVMCRAVVQNRA